MYGFLVYLMTLTEAQEIILCGLRFHIKRTRLYTDLMFNARYRVHDKLTFIYREFIISDFDCICCMCNIIFSNMT